MGMRAATGVARGGRMRAFVWSWMLLSVGCAGGAAQVEAGEPAAGGAVAAAGCPHEGGGDAPDGVDGALMIEPGDNAGCFATGDRKDTYVLESPAGQHTLYRITFEGRAATQGCIEMLDAGKKEARWTGRCGEAGALHSAWALVAPGSRWFLQVRDLAGTAGSEDRAYRLG